MRTVVGGVLGMVTVFGSAITTAPAFRARSSAASHDGALNARCSSGGSGSPGLPAGRGTRAAPPANSSRKLPFPASSITALTVSLAPGDLRDESEAFPVELQARIEVAGLECGMVKPFDCRTAYRRLRPCGFLPYECFLYSILPKKKVRYHEYPAEDHPHRAPAGGGRRSLLTGVSSYFAASNGVSRVAREFLAFKSSQLRKHAESQWTLLVENGLTGRSEMVEATREAVASYAATLATSATELTAAFATDGSVQMATGELELAAGEREAVASLALAKNTDYLTVDLGGVQRVGKGFWFEPFGWYVLVTEDRAAFYAGVNEICVADADHPGGGDRGGGGAGAGVHGVADAAAEAGGGLDAADHRRRTTSGSGWRSSTTTRSGSWRRRST